MNIEDNRVKITFANETENLSKEDMEHIFDRYYTSAKDSSRKTTGLGLSIAKMIVNKMGGKIYADVQDALFFITIEFIIEKDSLT